MTKLSRPARTGDKVKIYGKRDEVIYAEVIGIRKNGRLIVHSRDDFKTLPIGAFQHLRELKDVVFLNADAAPDQVREAIPQAAPRKSRKRNSALVEPCVFRFTVASHFRSKNGVWYPKKRKEVANA